jgi:hypothetical protein
MWMAISLFDLNATCTAAAPMVLIVPPIAPVILPANLPRTCLDRNT